MIASESEIVIRIKKVEGSQSENHLISKTLLLILLQKASIWSCLQKIEHSLLNPLIYTTEMLPMDKSIVSFSFQNAS